MEKEFATKLQIGRNRGYCNDLDQIKYGEAVARVNPETGESYLTAAIINKDQEEVLRIIENIISFEFLEVPNQYKQTPLHLAVLTKMPIVCRHLLAHGVEVTPRDLTANTPLHLACQYDNLLECVKVLTRPIEPEEVLGISHHRPLRRIPQNLNETNAEGYTCLHLAVQKNYCDIVDYLIDSCGVDVNVGDGKSGKTALHLAIENESEHIFYNLLHNHPNSNIDVNKVMYNQMTPLDYSESLKKYITSSYLVNVCDAQLNYKSDEEDEHSSEEADIYGSGDKDM